MYETIPNDNPPEYAYLPETRLRGDDVSMILGVFAAAREMEKATGDERMQTRLKTIRGGWRDARLVASALKRLTDALQWTVPREKRIGFNRTASRSRYLVMQGPLASKPKEGTEEIITTRELDELVSSAWEGRCRMCVDGQCDRCDLGKVLDGVLGQDRDGGSWSTIDIRRAK